MNKNPLILNVNHMMADTIGLQYGIDREQVESYAPFAAAANQAQYRPDPVSPAEGLSARLALLAGCEVLSHEWTEAVDRVRAAFSRQEPDWAAFMEQLYYPRQVDYEHLLVYFLFRYMPRAAYDFDAAGKMAFAVFATLVVRDLDWAVFVENGGHFSITDRIRTAGIVSREGFPLPPAPLFSPGPDLRQRQAPFLLFDPLPGPLCDLF